MVEKLLDKDKVYFAGDIINKVQPAKCPYNCTAKNNNKVVPITVGSSACLHCKYCYGMITRTWGEEIEGTIWYNSSYDGYVSCAYNNNPIVRKIKTSIFKFKGYPQTFKKLS